LPQGFDFSKTFFQDFACGARLSQAQPVRSTKYDGMMVDIPMISTCCGWDSRAPNMVSAYPAKSKSEQLMK
jgi:hypothetical protein